MRAIFYVPRARAAEAFAATERLRAAGHTALYRDTRGFAGDIEACDRVVTDDPHIAGAHAARGIDVAPFTTEQANAAGGGDPIEGEESGTDGEPGEGVQVGGSAGEADTPPVAKAARKPRTRRKR